MDYQFFPETDSFCTALIKPAHQCYLLSNMKEEKLNTAATLLKILWELKNEIYWTGVQATV